jgi:hypothetical protein
MFSDGWRVVHHEMAFEADKGRPLVQFVAERTISSVEKDDLVD